MNLIFVDEGNGASFEVFDAPSVPGVGDSVFIDQPDWTKAAPFGWTINRRIWIYKAVGHVVRLVVRATPS